MKKSFKALCLFLLLTCCVKLNFFSDLGQEMERLGVDNVLIFQSQEIDEYPLWSMDSNFIAVNIMGRWRKFNLKKVSLIEAEWHQKKIGFSKSSKGIFLDFSDLERENFLISHIQEDFVNQKGEKIQLIQKGFSTSLILTELDGQKKVLWKSEIESCHSLNLSPNKKYVAYICELNGLFIMKID
ncbi:MAG: hypothetical protein EBT63_07230 [Proteobacteria bacterium]|nr:hypothetical protein [Pseudomonadota bacterium]NCA29061.1 hypothetical protein [Pseudomonadota bacterium]